MPEPDRSRTSREAASRKASLALGMGVFSLLGGFFLPPLAALGAVGVWQGLQARRALIGRPLWEDRWAANSGIALGALGVGLTVPLLIGYG
jgi:hypothetical protein